MCRSISHKEKWIEGKFYLYIWPYTPGHTDKLTRWEIEVNKSNVRCISSDFIEDFTVNLIKVSILIEVIEKLGHCTICRIWAYEFDENFLLLIIILL